MLAQKSDTRKKERGGSVAGIVWPRNKMSGSEWEYDISFQPWKLTRKERFAYVLKYLLKNDKWHTKRWSVRGPKGSGVVESKFIWRKKEGKDKLANIIEALASTKNSLLSLEQDWDGEGSPGYSKETWERMANFLLNHCKQLAETCGVKTPTPKILPGPNGSIDLLWKSKNYELLLNIPTDSKTPASFYGDDKGSLSIKGKLDTAKINQGLLQWLMTHQTP